MLGVLNAQRSTLNTRHSTLNTQHSTINTQHSQHSTLNTQQSTLNTQHSTLNSQPSRHWSLTSLFQVALHLPCYIYDRFFVGDFRIQEIYLATRQKCMFGTLKQVKRGFSQNALIEQALTAARRLKVLEFAPEVPRTPKPKPFNHHFEPSLDALS